MDGDGPMSRMYVSHMSTQQLIAHVETLQVNRLRIQKELEEQQLKKFEESQFKLQADHEKQCAMLEKELASLDKLFLKIEKRINNISGIRTTACTAQAEFKRKHKRMFADGPIQLELLTWEE